MSKARILILSLSALTAASALAVGTQTPSAVSKDKTSYNGFVNQELTAAVNVADKASNAKDVTAIHENLRQVINCLAGPNGAGYDASIQDPCRRMGRGALVDITADSDEHRLVSQAFNEAKNGLAATNVDSAHDLASKALNDLENAKKDTEQ